MQSISVLLIDIDAPRPEIDEPLGIEVLAGAVRARFQAIDVTIDLHAPKLFGTDTLPMAKIQASQIVGLSTKLNSYERVRRALVSISKCAPKPLVLVGNIYGTFAFPALLREYPDVVCVRGEGEEALCGIIAVFLRNAKVEMSAVRSALIEADVPNLALIAAGELKETRRMTVNLAGASLPSRELVPRVKALQGTVLAEASRGCPWSKCAFCAITGKYGEPGWRPFQIEWILEDMMRLSAMGVRSPYYTDEDFFGNDPERVSKIADAVLAAKRAGVIRQDMNFYINTRIGTVLGHDIGGYSRSIEIFLNFKRAGLREVFLGIESGSKAQMIRYGKNATADANLRAIHLLRSLGLETDIGFMMFDPQMTLEELTYNVAFLRHAGLATHDARMTKRVRVEPFTRLESVLRKKGIIGTTLDIDDVTFPYDFRDAYVQAIYTVFRVWEMDAQDAVYKLQARVRGECPSEQVRMKRKRHLGLLRELDLEFLEACIRMADPDPGLLEKHLSARQEEFARRRLLLLKDIPD